MSSIVATKDFDYKRHADPEEKRVHLKTGDLASMPWIDAQKAIEAGYARHAKPGDLTKVSAGAQFSFATPAPVPAPAKEKPKEPARK